MRDAQRIEVRRCCTCTVHLNGFFFLLQYNDVLVVSYKRSINLAYRQWCCLLFM
jgi:hypothetical protein